MSPLHLEHFPQSDNKRFAKLAQLAGGTGGKFLSHEVLKFRMAVSQNPHRFGLTVSNCVLVRMQGCVPSKTTTKVCFL
jgi:hypothetical protein